MRYSFDGWVSKVTHNTPPADAYVRYHLTVEYTICYIVLPIQKTLFCNFPTKMFLLAFTQLLMLEGSSKVASSTINS